MTHTAQTPITVPFDQSLRPFNEQVQTSEYEAVNTTGNLPSQVLHDVPTCRHRAVAAVCDAWCMRRCT